MSPARRCQETRCTHPIPLDDYKELSILAEFGPVKHWNLKFFAKRACVHWVRCSRLRRTGSPAESFVYLKNEIPFYWKSVLPIFMNQLHCLDFDFLSLTFCREIKSTHKLRPQQVSVYDGACPKNRVPIHCEPPGAVHLSGVKRTFMKRQTSNDTSVCDGRINTFSDRK